MGKERLEVLRVWILRENHISATWLSDAGEMKVTNTVRVNFSIGNYTDTVECDVVPMTVCHLLLGRPWQYDREVRHYGKSNTHQFRWQGKDIVLRPMTPQDIVNESRQKTEVRLEQGQSSEPSLAVYDPSAVRFTSCFAAATTLVLDDPPPHGDADGLATATTAMTEIGRASCRERV